MSTSIARRLIVGAVGTLLLAGAGHLGWLPQGAGTAEADEAGRPPAVADAVDGDPRLFIPDPLPPAAETVDAGGPADRHDGAARTTSGAASTSPESTGAPGRAPSGLPGVPGLGILGLLGSGAGELNALLSTTGLTAKQDTFVSAVFPNTNYGGQSPVFVGENPTYGATRSLFWFDMKDLPKNQAVTEARMELYLREAGPAGDPGRDVVTHRVKLGRNSDGTCKSSWDERDPTWNNFPDYSDSRLSSDNVGTTRGTYDWGLTDLTQKWRLAFWWPSNECNGGIYLQGYETAGSFRGFDSSEGSNKPKLIIDHETDTKPPVATMSVLPPYTTQADPANPGKAAIKLAWEGSDPSPGTGIDFFQLFVRNSNSAANPWQLIGDRLQTFGGTFLGDNGVRWEFVVYPTDQAGNVQAGKGPDAATLVDLNYPVTTPPTLPPYEPGPFDMTWTAQEMPNGAGQINSGIAYYDVQYNIGGGSWGDLGLGLPEPRVHFGLAQQNVAYQFRWRTVDKAGNQEPWGPAQAQTFVDGVAPVILYVRAPFAVGERTFLVSWLGDDQGGSGLVNYDLQVRVDQGTWTDWVTNSTETSKSYTGAYGRTYSFRARARDKAGNVGTYPDPPQLVTAVVDPDSLKFNVRLPWVSK